MHHSFQYNTSSTTTFQLPSAIPECQIELRKIQGEIRQLERSASTIRQTEQEELYNAAIQNEDTKTAKALKYRILAEHKKTMFQKLWSIRSVAKSTLTRLDIPRDPSEKDYKNCIHWISLDMPETIEECLIERNQYHFGHAQCMYLTIPPFSEWVDWSASSHTAYLILKGQFNSNEIDK